MEPIAVIGIGCRFPQAPNPDAFWQLLRDGKEAISPIPEDRWQVPAFYDPDPKTPGKMNVCCGGFLQDVDGFDAEFFGMSREEVEHTDPQQRLFLEVAWEALENAGIAPGSLAKSQTGVFTGLCTIDYHRLLYKNYERLSSYSGTGTTMCITANRLSYLLDLQGPSMAIDAACSSSLVTVHLACQSLRSRESNLCLAGGINLILSPDSTISSAKTRLLSVAGRCKSFDAEADGYARGEGCGVIVLKRLADAVANNDNILALIRGSAVNHNGLSNSLSAPNGLAQQAVIRQALSNAGVEPAEVSYIDAHAVGTGIGDAIEFKALQAVYGQGRKSHQPCGVGSVKTNIGHLEAAAGISALIKVILALQHEAIPPNLHLNQLNPYISLKEEFYIPTQLKQWSTGNNSRLGAVSAFGFGGTNAHVILEEAPNLEQQLEVKPAAPGRHLITLSAKSPAALQQLVQKYQDFVELHPQVDLASLAVTANTGRNHFKHRLCLITNSITQMRQQLTAFANSSSAEGLFTGEVKGRKRPQLAWFFPGNSLDFETADIFYQTQPIFREAVERCEQVGQSYLSPLLSEGLSSSTRIKLASSNPFLGDRYTQFVIEYAVAQLWLNWGIKPNAVMGLGIGELVATTIAGMLSLEDALRVVAIQPLQSNEAAFTSLLKAINQIPPQIPLLSARKTLTSKKIVTPEYWSNYWQQPEIYSNPLATLSDYQLVLSMGVKTSVPVSDNTEYLFSLGFDSAATSQEAYHSLAKLYIQGWAVDWLSFAGVDRQPLALALPTYPFQRQRYWFAAVTEKSPTATKPIAQLL